MRVISPLTRSVRLGSLLPHRSGSLAVFKTGGRTRHAAVQRASRLSWAYSSQPCSLRAATTAWMTCAHGSVESPTGMNPAGTRPCAGSTAASTAAASSAPGYASNEGSADCWCVLSPPVSPLPPMIPPELERLFELYRMIECTL